MIGGQVSSRKTVNLNEGYPPKTVRWAPHRDLQSLRHGLTAEEVNGTIYGIGAGPDPRVDYSHAQRNISC